jgi:hypothetical protein
MRPLSGNTPQPRSPSITSARAGGSRIEDGSDIRPLTASIRPEPSRLPTFFDRLLRRPATATLMPASGGPAIPPTLLEAQLLDALRRWNTKDIKRLMRQGADPSSINTNTSRLLDEDIMKLKQVIAVRRLYPSGQVRAPKKIDQALLDFDFEKADRHLKKAIAKLSSNYEPDMSSPRGQWQRAVDLKKHDILRGMLALGRTEGNWDSDREKRLAGVSSLHSAITPDAPQALAVFLKQWPYFSRKEKRSMDSLNLQVKFKDSPENTIVCAHMAFHWIELRLERQRQRATGDPVEPFHYDHFLTKEALQDNIPITLQEKYTRSMGSTTENHCWRNRDWGKKLAKQFTDMAREGTDHKLMMIESINHSRALELKIKKQDDGTSHYVANFYDPNQSNHMRVMKFHPEDFRQMSMEEMSADPMANYMYHPVERPERTVSFVQVITGDELRNPAPPMRRILMDLTIPVTPQIVYGWMMHGFAGNLDKDVKPLLSAKSISEIVDLLSSKLHDGIPALYFALQNDHADTVRVYCELIDDLLEKGRLKKPQDWAKVVEMLSARTAKEVPGVCTALINGGAEAIQVYCEFLGKLSRQGLLSPSQLFEMMSSRNSAVYPTFYEAMYRGHTEKIKAIGKLVLNSGLSPAEQVTLLRGRMDNEQSALWQGANNGHADAVAAHCDLLLKLPITDEKKAELFADAPSKGLGPYQLAQENGKQKGIENDKEKKYAETAQHIKDAIQSLDIPEERKAEILRT